jgi:hypothetical protein
MCYNLFSKCVHCGYFIDQVDKPCDSRGRLWIRDLFALDFCKRFGTFDGFGIVSPHELFNVHRPVKSGFRISLPIATEEITEDNKVILETKVIDKPLCLHSAREVAAFCYWCKDDAKRSKDYEFMVDRTGIVDEVVFRDNVSNGFYLNRMGKFCYYPGSEYSLSLISVRSLIRPYI